MDNAVSLILGILGGLGVLFSIVSALTTYRRNAKHDDQEDGQAAGTICTELGYIKGGIDDIKTDQREQRKIITDLSTQLASVEVSTEQAHHRIDTLEHKFD